MLKLAFNEFLNKIACLMWLIKLHMLLMLIFMFELFIEILCPLHFIVQATLV